MGSVRALAVCLAVLGLSLPGCRGASSDRPADPRLASVIADETLEDLRTELDGYARARAELGEPFSVIRIEAEASSVIAVVDRGQGPEEARWNAVRPRSGDDLEPANYLAEVLSGGGRRTAHGQ